VSLSPPPPPPPPPPAGDAPVGGAPGAAPFSVGAAVGFGWNAFWRNAGPMLLITVVIIAVTAVVNLLSNFTSSVVLDVVFSIASWIVGLLVGFGLIRASLAVTRGEKPEVGMLFRGDNFGPYVLASIVFGLGAALGLILLVVPGIIFMIVFQFYGYVLSEGSSGGAMAALARSAEITKGRRWELFGLGIVLFLITLVGLLLCCVGLIFTYPITALATAYAYRSLNGEPVVAP
jgi:hypothetical protein